MAWFKTLNTTDSKDMYSLLTFANSASDNIFMPIMLLVIWVVWVLGAVFTGKPIHRSVLFASFICSILSILMVIMNWLSVSYMYFAFFMTAIGIIWTWLAEAYS